MFPKSTKILVIDDMPSIRELVRSQLKSMGYVDVHEADSGEAGLTLLNQQYLLGKPFQLVISDWNMPVKSGLDLLKQIRAISHYVDLPFVLLTSESERDQVTEAVLAGVSQYIVKPFSAKIFEDKLKGAWDKHNR